MSLLALMMAVFTVNLGDALRLEHPHEPGLAGIELRWQNQDVPFFRNGDVWETIIGADLGVRAGDHAAAFTLRYSDGRRAQKQETIRVMAKSFPETRLTVEPQFVDLSPEDQARSNRESQRLGQLFRQITPERLWNGPFQVPIPGREGSNFGHRRVFNDQPRAPHSGADIAAVTGTPIQSTNRGRVVETGDYFFNGNTVIVDHGLGIYSVYLHLSRIDVEPGQMVEAGDVLGLVGATGRVTGPHLHWGFRVQNALVDPFSMTRVAP